MRVAAVLLRRCGLTVAERGQARLFHVPRLHGRLLRRLVVDLAERRAVVAVSLMLAVAERPMAAEAEVLTVVAAADTHIPKSIRREQEKSGGGITSAALFVVCS